MTASTNGHVLEVSNLSVTFRTEDGLLSAVDRVSLEVGDGEVLAVVGESGCGKSVTAMSLAGLLPRTATVEGSVKLDGVELIGADKRTLRSIRGREVAYIFQEPMTSLNPVFTVGHQIGEVLRTHVGVSRQAAQAIARSNSSSSSGSRPPSAGSATTRTNSPAGCASA